MTKANLDIAGDPKVWLGHFFVNSILMQRLGLPNAEAGDVVAPQLSRGGINCDKR